ncbi:hypothetical protein Bca52824_035705 [Brassica carinata]|uniref:Uncharacterized protein n=1 Tax=Brassica carinata TaxID=52824 RepID=A0A8X7S3R5_BRACI|nr:hypothetical protein Bca52824_035705 [Brassica carinata]
MEVSLCLAELDLTQQPPTQMARDLKGHFKDIAISIRLNDLTKLEDLTETTAMIRTEKFRVRNYEQIIALANTNMDQPVCRLAGSQDASNSTSIKYGGVKKNETVTLTELNTYILNSPSQKFISRTKTQSSEIHDTTDVSSCFSATPNSLISLANPLLPHERRRSSIIQRNRIQSSEKWILGRLLKGGIGTRMLMNRCAVSPFSKENHTRETREEDDNGGRILVE